MPHLPTCRPSRYLSESTKERYHQCTNINCGHTVVTLESITRSIVEPGKINPVTPHPVADNQFQMWV
ncbi:ogr/Delta-like zinc finger family protein [Brenneria sp. g21c3]|uniref:ogr/Delta-like zinc finger family protein n=1 Tax=Brenneria sp. g21c3 TaxID=3093893 RepID=UPI002EBD8417|nr:ogr/Delta-like zinc finger family protein [Brenneria sp. g21c3]